MLCRGSHRLANPAHLSLFPIFGLHCVALYRVLSGVKVLTEGRGFGAGAFADQIRRVNVRGKMSLVPLGMGASAQGCLGYPARPRSDRGGD